MISRAKCEYLSIMNSHFLNNLIFESHRVLLFLRAKNLFSYFNIKVSNFFLKFPQRYCISKPHFLDNLIYQGTKDNRVNTFSRFRKKNQPTFPACLSHQSCDYHVNITCQKMADNIKKWRYKKDLLLRLMLKLL